MFLLESIYIFSAFFFLKKFRVSPFFFAKKTWNNFTSLRQNQQKKSNQTTWVDSLRLSRRTFTTARWWSHKSLSGGQQRHHPWKLNSKFLPVKVVTFQTQTGKKGLSSNHPFLGAMLVWLFSREGLLLIVFQLGGQFLRGELLVFEGSGVRVLKCGTCKFKYIS